MVVPGDSLWSDSATGDSGSLGERGGGGGVLFRCAGNVNSVIGRMYLGITCGLTQPQGILGVWGERLGGGGGLLQRAKLWELQM